MTETDYILILNVPNPGFITVTTGVHMGYRYLMSIRPPRLDYGSRGVAMDKNDINRQRAFVVDQCDAAADTTDIAPDAWREAHRILKKRWARSLKLADEGES